jgi:hypothetical protein
MIKPAGSDSGHAFLGPALHSHDTGMSCEPVCRVPVLRLFGIRCRSRPSDDPEPFVGVSEDEAEPAGNSLPGRSKTGSMFWCRSGRSSKPGTKVKGGGGVNLRNPGFDDTKDKSDLLHRRFLVIVEGHDQTLAFGQFVDGLG